MNTLTPLQPLIYTPRANDRFTNKPSEKVWYATKKVPIDIPLYFKIEAGFEGGDELDVIVSLYEASDDVLMSQSELLTSKTVRISNSTKWYVITSDYPVYKTKESTYLKLVVAFSSENAVYFQLNYAQVGSDPISLGGRGSREKHPHTYVIPESLDQCCEMQRKYLRKKGLDVHF